MKFSFEGESWELEKFCETVINGTKPRKKKAKNRAEFVRPLYCGTTYELPLGTCAKVKAMNIGDAINTLREILPSLDLGEVTNLARHIRSV